MEWFDLEKMIAEFSQKLKDTEAKIRDFGRLWAEVKEINQAFRMVKYPTPEEKDKAKEKFEELISHLKSTQDNLRESAAQNFQALKEKITVFSEEVSASLNDPDNNVIRKLWDDIKDISAKFRDLKMVDPLDREKTWIFFQETVDKIKNLQNQQREERLHFEENSSKSMKKIVAEGEKARPPKGILESLSGELIPSFDLIANLISKYIPGAHTIEGWRDDLKNRSEALKKAWDTFHTSKDKMAGKDKHETHEILREISESLDKVWDKYKEIREKQKTVERTNNPAFVEKQTKEIEKLNDRLASYKEQLERKEAHLFELQENLKSSTNDDYKSKVEKWISEDNQKIDGLKQKITQVEGWIKEHEARIK